MQPKPNRRSEVTLLRMTLEERALLEEVAQRQGKTMTQTICDALRQVARQPASSEVAAA